MNTRDRRPTPTNASLIAGWDEATSREIVEVKLGTASDFYLDGEGTSGDKDRSESKDTVRIIPNKISNIQNIDTKKKIKFLKKDNYRDKDRSESKDTVRIIPNKISNIQNIDTKKKIKFLKKDNYRVPVQYPDGKPGMPTSNKKVNRLLKEGKAEIVKNKLNIFAIKLKFWPIYRETQPIVLLIDPGSTFTGIAVMSKKCINISYMLELPGYKKGSKPFTVINKHGKEIQKYHNSIVERMEKRSQLRRGRRHRKCRRRECRFLNRSKKGKLAPSMLAKKQLELETVKVLSKLYPIQIIGFEDVSFNHWGDKDGTKGQFFSQVEIGKNWLLERLRTYSPNPIRIIKGYETNYKRIQLKLPKGEDKTKRSIKSHVTDCISMGYIILNIDSYPGNKFHFNVISRPKYSRRILFAEQPGKGGVFERYGGHIPNIPTFKGLRKGDYVEARAPNLKKIYRGWVSGYTGDRIYISDFDWNQSQAFSVDNIRLLDRNHGLVSLRLGWIKDIIDIDRTYGTKQQGIEGDFIKIKKEKMIDDSTKFDNTIQKGINDAWT